MAGEVMIHEFENGLTLVAEPRPDVRAAAFHVIVPAGAVTEPDDRPGLAKVLAEMCTRGAGDRDSRSLSDALDALGIQRAGASDSVVASFGGAMLADDLHAALALHADILRRPRLDEKELPHVVALALQELRSIEDHPAQKMMVHLQQTYFTNEYGRSPLGTGAGLASITPADLRADHARRYRPGRGVVSVAGRFEWAGLLSVVGSLFGDWDGAPPPLPVPEARAEPAYLHVAQETAQQHIGMAYASVPIGHPEFYAARMAVDVLSGGMSARLFTEVREKRGLAYAVSASAASVEGHGYVMGYAGTTPDRAQETLDVFTGELRRLGADILEDEVDRSRTRVLARLVMQGESTRARAEAIALDMLNLGRVRSLEEIRSAVAAVSGASIIAHLEACPPHDFTVVTLGPRPLQPLA